MWTKQTVVIHSCCVYVQDLPLRGRACLSLAGKPCLLLQFVHFPLSSPREAWCSLLWLPLLHLTRRGLQNTDPGIGTLNYVQVTERRRGLEGTLKDLDLDLTLLLPKSRLILLMSYLTHVLANLFLDTLVTGTSSISQQFTLSFPFLTIKSFSRSLVFCVTV